MTDLSQWHWCDIPGAIPIHVPNGQYQVGVINGTALVCNPPTTWILIHEYLSFTIETRNVNRIKNSYIAECLVTY